ALVRWRRRRRFRQRRARLRLRSGRRLERRRPELAHALLERREVILDHLVRTLALRELAPQRSDEAAELLVLLGELLRVLVALRDFLAELRHGLGEHLELFVANVARAHSGRRRGG